MTPMSINLILAPSRTVMVSLLLQTIQLVSLLSLTIILSFLLPLTTQLVLLLGMTFRVPKFIY
jgi:hypothetical protein